MRDHDHGRVVFALQLVHHLQDLRLDRHVQRRGRLVGNQQLRLTHQRDGNDHALLHTAGKLVRVFIFALGRNADQRQNFVYFFFDLLRMQLRVYFQTLRDLLAHGHDRVQARHRILKNHRDTFAADQAHAALVKLHQIVSVKDDLARAARRAFRQEPENGKRRCCFACAGLADDTERLAAVNAEADAIDGLCRHAAGMKLDMQVVYFQ